MSSAPTQRSFSAAGNNNNNNAARAAQNADADLARMGYKSSLPRSLSMLSILGMSFAIMAVPFGTSTTLNIALTDGGPVTILYGVRIRRVSPCYACSSPESRRGGT